MINIYKLDIDTKLREFVKPVTADVHEFFQMFDGRQFSQQWVPIELKLMTVGDHGEKLSATDNYYFAAHVFAFSIAAIEVLGDYLTSTGEILQTKCKDRTIKLYNCTNLIDAINETVSNIARFPDGRIIAFRRLVLDQEKCVNQKVFKLTKDPLGSIFVSEEIRQRITQAQLKGFIFEMVELQSS